MQSTRQVQDCIRNHVVEWITRHGSFNFAKLAGYDMDPDIACPEIAIEEARNDSLAIVYVNWRYY